MAFSLIPDRVYSSIFEIDGTELSRHGVSLLLADLDNTLAKYGQPDPEPAVQQWKCGLAEAGVELFLLSNSRKPTRAGHYARCRTPAQTAMVGDQIFTDILGAKRAGVLALMVEPMELRGNPGRYLRYAVEEPFRALGRRR